MSRTVLSYLVGLLLVVGCDRLEYYPDKPLPETVTRVIGHRGGGESYGDNTLVGIQTGLTLLDGVEVDLEFSADGTIWLNHSYLTEPCGSFGEKCFSEMTDQQIEDLNECRDASLRIPKLEEVFRHMQGIGGEKYISLDVKAWKPCGLDGLNVTRQMNKMAQAIIDLTRQYHLENHVMVESETGDFLYYIRKNSNFIETYLTTLGDFELGVSRALDAKFSGVSFQFRTKETLIKEQVDLLHRKGLKIQLWLVNEVDEKQEALALGVDFIQTGIF
jgi:glycerophosphoryl diester phosphodiesterase